MYGLDFILDQLIGGPDLVDLRPAGNVGANGDIKDMCLGKRRANLRHDFLKTLKHLVWSSTSINVISSGINNHGGRAIGGDDTLGIDRHILKVASAETTIDDFAIRKILSQRLPTHNAGTACKQGGTLRRRIGEIGLLES